MRRARAACRSRASSTSSATTSGRTRRRSSSASAPGREVRLRYAYFITCTSVVKDGRGEVIELRCTYDPATRGGDAPDGRKVKATLHWVSAAHAVAAEVRLYDRLFTRREPRRRATTSLAHLNPTSLEVLAGARSSRALAGAAAGHALPVRAARLLLRRPRLDAGPPGLQPHRHAQGHLGPHRTTGLTACLSPGRFDLLRRLPTATSDEQSLIQSRLLAIQPCDNLVSCCCAIC